MSLREVVIVPDNLSPDMKLVDMIEELERLKGLVPPEELDNVTVLFEPKEGYDCLEVFTEVFYYKECECTNK